MLQVLALLCGLFDLAVGLGVIVFCGCLVVVAGLLLAT